MGHQKRRRGGIEEAERGAEEDRVKMRKIKELEESINPQADKGETATASSSCSNSFPFPDETFPEPSKKKEVGSEELIISPPVTNPSNSSPLNQHESEEDEVGSEELIISPSVTTFSNSPPHESEEDDLNTIFPDVSPLRSPTNRGEQKITEYQNEEIPGWLPHFDSIRKNRK